MKKFIILIVILLLSQKMFSQAFFEGEITFKFNLEKKDSSFDETSIITYPSTITIGIYKNGDWLQKPDDGIIEYVYFNHTANKLYWKIKNSDTLLYEMGDKQRESEVDPTLTSKIEKNTDTILGFPCNRLIIVTSKVKLIFIYTSSIATNPLWYQSTKMGYYNIIYGKTRAIYLKSIVETKDYISITTAQDIHRRKVFDSELPDTKKIPLQRL